MGKSRHAEHAQFLNWLIDTAIRENIDAIIVAGDIFDTGSPPSYARELYNRFIVKLQPTGIHLVILGGNHDSVATLGESKELLACLNTHVIPGVMANLNDHVITLNNASGIPQAIICAIPYLRPHELLHSTAGQSGTKKQQHLQQAIAEHYQAIYHLAEQQQTDIKQVSGQRVPIIATGHLATVGAKSSESVRDIYIGSLDAFVSSAFPPADYIALGHIHRPQCVGKTEHIRYCGSPIPLSFDELNNTKTVLLVTFNEKGFVEANPREVPRYQGMHLIKGDLEDIALAINTLATQYSDSHTAWLDIEVNTQEYLQDLYQRIETMTEGLPLEVLLVRRNRKQYDPQIEAKAKETLQELSPKEVFDRRLSLEDWNSDNLQAQKARIIQAFDTLLHDVTDITDT